MQARAYLQLMGPQRTPIRLAPDELRIWLEPDEIGEGMGEHILLGGSLQHTNLATHLRVEGQHDGLSTAALQREVAGHNRHTQARGDERDEHLAFGGLDGDVELVNVGREDRLQEDAQTLAAGHRYDRPAPEVRVCNRGPASERIVGRNHRDEGLLARPLHDEPCSELGWNDGNGKIQVAYAHRFSQLGRVARGGQLEVHTGVRGSEAGERGGQHIGAEGRGGSDPQDPGFARSGSSSCALRLRDRFQGSSCRLDDDATGGCGDRPVAPALEENDPQLALESPEAPAERWLGRSEPDGGRGQCALAIQHDQKFEVTSFHIAMT